MNTPEQLFYSSELQRRLQVEHNPRVQANTFIDFTWVMLDTNEERSKRVEYVKIIKPEDNVYHAAFIIENISRNDCKLIIECVQEYFTLNNQFTIGPGLHPTMHWNETPGKELDFSALHKSERNIDDLKFTNRVFIYTNEFDDRNPGNRDELQTMFKESGYIVSLRDTKTWNIMQEKRKADFFLCHDSRDKPTARELL